MVAGGLALWLALVAIPLSVALGGAVGQAGGSFVPWSTWISSCAIAAVVALTAVVLGYAPGQCLGTCTKAGDSLWVLVMVSVVLPPYLLYYAWMVCLSPATSLGRAVAGVPQAALIAGRVAATGVLVMWTWPLAALVQAAGWRRMDRSTWEAALLDGGRRHRAWYVTWPLLCGPMVLAFGLCFVLVLSEVSTFDLGGMRTIGTELATLYQLTGSEAAVANAAWPLVAVAAAVAFGLARQLRPGPPHAADGLLPSIHGWTGARRITIALLILSLGVPVGLLVTAATDGQAVSQFLRLHGDDLAASLVIAVVTAFLACGIAAGALEVRRCGRVGQGLSLLMQVTIWISLLVPGSLVAVSILRLLAVCHVPDVIRSSWLVVSFGQAGRLAGVALILLLLARGRGRLQVLSEMAAVDGAPPAAAWWHVHLPLSWRMVVGAALVVMMLSMTELAATMVLLPPGVPNFAQRLLNQMHYARDPQTMASCLVLVASFAVLAAVVVGLVRTVRSFHACVAAVVLCGMVVFAGCGRRSDGDDRPAVEACFGSTGKGQGQFMYPRAIEMATDRTLFVIDKAGRVQHFTAQGQFLDEFQMPQIEMGKPTGLTLSPDGDLYIADTHYSRVTVYSQAGRLKRQFGRFGREDGCFIYPTDVAFSGDCRVFVSEYGGNDRVSVFDGQGRFQYSFGSPGHDKGQFSRPAALCADPERDLLYVADACNHRIAVYTYNGRLVKTIGSLGVGRGQLRYPYGLTRLANGNLVVCEYGNNRLQVFTPQGDSVAVYGRAGRGPGELAYPWAVAADPSGLAYVVDSGNNRIQIWQL